MGNPLPPPTGPTNAGGVSGFLDNFRFQNAQTGTHQDIYNQLAQKFGPNAAMSWMASNAQNQLSGGLSDAMNQAGIDRADQNRIINTYGARTKDLGRDSGYGYEGVLGFDPKYQSILSQLSKPATATGGNALQTGATDWRTMTPGVYRAY
jgi:hypothetical protein